MKLLSKLILPVLALNLVASSAIIAEPKYVYELFTNKQAAVLAATTTGLFGAMAWAINEDINATVAYKKKNRKELLPFIL